MGVTSTSWSSEDMMPDLSFPAEVKDVEVSYPIAEVGLDESFKEQLRALY
jgi:hypothetical protein